jgi:hypothetical protein
MQDRYAGDVGDFGKFSLLRSVFASDSNKIGIIWYKFPDEDHNRDGLHVSYLEDSKYKICDNELIEKLSLVVSVDRTISKLEALRLLPGNTVYYSAELDFHLLHPGQTKLAKDTRRDKRMQWLQQATNSANECNIVFIDPDNGLEIQSIPNIHQINSGKYAYYSEVAELFKNKDACIIYHHMNMNNSHQEQIKFRTQELKDKIVKEGSVFALRFSPYSPRAFFMCVSQQAAPAIRDKIHSFVSDVCGKGWDTYHEA